MIKYTLIYSSQKLESFYEVAHPRDTCENGTEINEEDCRLVATLFGLPYGGKVEWAADDWNQQWSKVEPGCTHHLTTNKVYFVHGYNCDQPFIKDVAYQLCNASRTEQPRRGVTKIEGCKN